MQNLCTALCKVAKRSCVPLGQCDSFRIFANGLSCHPILFLAVSPPDDMRFHDCSPEMVVFCRGRPANREPVANRNI